MKPLIILALFLLAARTQAQEASLHRVFTFGNVADIAPNSEFFSHLEGLLSNIDVPYTILITGDMVNEDVTRTNTSPFYTTLAEKVQRKFLKWFVCLFV